MVMKIRTFLAVLVIVLAVAESVCTYARETSVESMNETSGSITLYVSRDGDDTNDGFTWNTALWSISAALESVSCPTSGSVEIWVAEGTYAEKKTVEIPAHVDLYGGFGGFEAEMSERDLEKFMTVIDGEETSRCVTNRGTLDGIHVVRGKANSGGGIVNYGYLFDCKIYNNISENCGGGVENYWIMTRCSVFSNTGRSNGAGIENYGEVNACIVYDNTARRSGGGIYCNSGSVINSVVFGNKSYSHGSGIYNKRGIVKGCNIYQNMTTDDFGGGGIFNDSGIVENCNIYENISHYRGNGIFNLNGYVHNCDVFKNEAALYVGFGAGIYNEDGKVENSRIYNNKSSGVHNYYGDIINCIIYNNIGSQKGGGIFNISGNVVNCVIYGNEADSYGGIYSSNGNVNHCTVFRNTALDFGGIFNSSGVIRNSIVWNNYKHDIYPVSDIFYSCFGESHNDYGNMRADPDFINTDGDIQTWDLRLANGSPCVDAGDISTAPATDISGARRPGGDGKVCMGAYESPDDYTQGTTAQPLARFYVSSNGDDGNDGLTWDSSFRTIKVAVVKVQQSNELSEIWVAQGLYNEGETLGVPLQAEIFGGFAGYESSPYDRDIEQYRTIIDGQNTYRSVENNGIIDGFYITRGNADEWDEPPLQEKNGGGVYNTGIIRNCHIYQNNSSAQGGGVYNSGSVENCSIYQNTSRYDGGGIFNVGLVRNCRIFQNKSNGCGGGAYNYANINNCIVYFNEAKYESGGISNRGSVFNCTIYRNISEQKLFSGIYNNRGTVVNCISWNNDGNDIYPSINTFFCCFGQADGFNGNIRSNPLFMNIEGDITTWDFRLQDGSACIGAGRIEGAPSYDINGEPRPGENGKICMGAHESPDDYMPGPIGVTAKRYYVSLKGNNENDGLTWDKPLRHITKAIDMITNADDIKEIWVQSGTYIEPKNITIPPRVNLYGGFSGTETDLSHRLPHTHKTMIDYNFITNWGLLSGFYLSKSRAERGGAIDNNGITDTCDVFSCTASDKGGGIFNKGTVNNCSIYKCIAKYKGGGIYNQFGRINSCRIFGNSAMSGGGIHGYDGGSDLISMITNCVVYANSGGGITTESNGIIINCTAYQNSGGFGIFGKSVMNCISWQNEPWDIDPSQAIYNSCFRGADGANGNISANPLFVTVEGPVESWDLGLRDGSPCIDAGTTESAPQLDILGNLRPGDDGMVCMGAYESPADFFPRPQQKFIKRLYVSNRGNDDNDGGSWENAMRSIIQAINRASQINLAETQTYCSMEIWVAEGTWSEGEKIIVPLYVRLYGGFAGNETDISQRDTNINKTIIDGENGYECVRNLGLLDSFHITKGKGQFAGIYNYGTVANCEIYNNTSEYEGGGIFNRGTVINSSVYSNISSNQGGGVFNYNATIKNSRIYNNTSALEGGGVYNTYNSILVSCEIYKNQSHADGGGAYNIGNSEIESCLVYENHTKSRSGGIHNYGRILRSSIFRNTSDEYVGGVTNIYEIDSCKIFENKAGIGVGGISNATTGIVTNCVLYLNSPDGLSNGGIVYNCTLFGNYSSSGSGIFNRSGLVVNCISWNNEGSDIVGQAKNSCFKNAVPYYGNLDSHPIFVNTNGEPETWDFRLHPDSPCIDSGISEGSPRHDIKGAKRPQGKGCDMGAYEYHISGLMLDCLLGRYSLKSDMDANQDGRFDMSDYISTILEESR